MNKNQWRKAYHLARLSTCINRRACVEEEAEVKAYRELHELIQSGFLARKDFWAAQNCVQFYRYPHDAPNTPNTCLLYTSPSPRDGLLSRMPSSA